MDDFGLKGGRYNSTLPTLTNGQPVELQVDVNGRLLVQTDVAVNIDFLGINGASDDANILIVGTEDGTSGGTAHAVRVAADGSIAIQDNGGSITVDATDLDIRDLDATQDNVAISDGTNTLAVNANGSLDVEFAAGAQIEITDGTDTLEVNADGSINSVVTATDLDIRDLTSVSDSVEVLQDTHDDLNVNANIQVGDADVANGNPVPVSDAGGSLTVDATDLDIRDLDATQDNVAISDGTNTLAVNANGSLDVEFAAGAQIEITDGTDTLEINGDGSLNAVVTATDLDIRDLTSATDSVEVLQDTHDDLNANANIQVGDTDVSNGNPVPMSDAGGSITVDSVDLDIRDLAFATDSVDVSGSDVTATVSATDLDIRDLSASQDNVAISDGTDTLAVNTDGSINVVATDSPDGVEAYAITDNQAAGDGEYSITSTYSNAFTAIAVGAGQTLHIYGWQWCSDDNAQARIIIDDDGTISTLKTSMNSSAQPSVDSHFSDAGRIEVVGAVDRTVVVQIKKRSGGGSASASASLHARLV